MRTMAFVALWFVVVIAANYLDGRWRHRKDTR